MRKIARTDRNQTEIITAFRKFGCSVLDMHQLGNGKPDICVGKNFKNVLIEIKSDNNDLTIDEEKFHNEWLGLVLTVRNLSDVIAIVKALER